MKRRNFLLSGSASLATVGLTACGGGADGQGEAAISETGTLRSTGTVAGDPAAATLTAGATAEGGTQGASRAVKQSGTASPTSAVRYPFGARLTPYAAGILPSQSEWTTDDLLRRQYDAWKAARLVPVGWIAPGGYAVQSSQWNTLTVSEAMGYGMLLTVLFAGHDPNARSIFDGLLAVVRARPAWAVTPHYAGGNHLMDWKLPANGSAGDGWNALDGDLDIALALLMADKQWGSSSGWNYLQEAKNTIEAIKSWNVKSDGTMEGLSNRSHNRTSDYMTGHFRAFKAATGDGIWDQAIDRAYWLTNHLQNSFSAGVGLMPDFVMNADSGWPYPSTGYIGDGNDKEGYFWWNACRNPWRFASDYVLSGDWRLQQVTGRMIDFFQSSSGGDPMRIGTGYALDGRMLTGGNSGAYNGPICAGACVDAKYQGFLDAMWNWNASHLTTGYYDSEIQLLSMVVASGNWWTPAVAFGSGSGTVTQGQQQTAPQQQPAPAPAGGNVLTNGDFASGMNNWENWGNAWVAAGALNVGTGAGGAGQQVGGKLTAGTKYQLTGTANITGPGEGVYVGIKLMDQWGGVLVDQLQTVDSQSPTGVSISFTAPQGATSGYVFVWKNGSGVVGVVDNLSLAPAGSGGTTSQPAPTAPAGGGSELLDNGTFASGMGNWENWGNSWVSGGVLNVGTGAGGVAQNIANKVTAGRKYQVGITGNLTAPSEGVFVGVKLMNSWGGVVLEQMQLVSSVTPASASIAFTAPQGATSGYVFVWKNASGALALVQKLSLVAV